MSNEKSRLRKSVEEIPMEKRKLHRSLTRISMKVGKTLRKSDLTEIELEKKIGRYNEERPGEYMARLLGGGIDLTLRTIYKLEEVLDVNLIEVPEPESQDPGKRRPQDT